MPVRRITKIQPGDEVLSLEPLMNLPNQQWIHFNSDVNALGALRPALIFHRNSMQQFLAGGPRDHPVKAHQVSLANIRQVPVNVIARYRASQAPGTSQFVKPVPGRKPMTKQNVRRLARVGGVGSRGRSAARKPKKRPRSSSNSNYLPSNRSNSSTSKKRSRRSSSNNNVTFVSSSSNKQAQIDALEHYARLHRQSRKNSKLASRS